MADAFNPYRAWLGIVSPSLPPTHYELLGLAAARCDPQAVAEGFRRQMSRLNPHLSGEHAATAQRIASELANARVVLLTPTTKRAYDAQLAARGAAAPQTRPIAGESTAAGSLSTAGSADDLLPPAAGPIAAPASALMANAPPANQPPPNQPPPPTLTSPAYPAAPAFGPAPGQAFPTPVAPTMGQAAPGYPAVPGYAYGQPFPAQGYPGQPGFPVQQPYPGQQPFAAQAPAAAYPGPAGQAESPVPAVSTGLPTSVSRITRSKRSSAAPMLVGVLIAGIAVTGAVIYLVKADSPQVVAGNGSNPAADGRQTRPGSPAVNAGPDQPAEAVRRRRPSGAKPPKVAPVSSSSKEKLFADEPEPMRVDPNTMPGETPDEMPKPGASAQKPEMVKPAPKPPAANSPVATPEEKAAVGEALAAARRALADRDFEQAEDQLAQATLEASAPELLAEIERLQFMARYLQDFWDAVRQHMAKLESAETITVDGDELSIIESSDAKIIFRVAGKRREYTLEKLPGKLAYWLADTWLDKSNPASLATLGAYHALDAAGDRQLARQLFQQASSAGFDARLLLAELDSQGEGK